MFRTPKYTSFFILLLLGFIASHSFASAPNKDIYVAPNTKTTNLSQLTTISSHPPSGMALKEIVVTGGEHIFILGSYPVSEQLRNAFTHPMTHSIKLKPASAPAKLKSKTQPSSNYEIADQPCFSAPPFSLLFNGHLPICAVFLNNERVRKELKKREIKRYHDEGLYALSVLHGLPLACPNGLAHLLHTYSRLLMRAANDYPPPHQQK